MATIMRKMNVISRCESIYRAENSSLGLPGIFHSYFFAICNNPGITQEGLGKHLCKNKSSVTRHLTHLEKDGYIERKTCEKDRREILVYPTDKMLSLMPEIKKITLEWNKKIAEDITKEELETFHRVLDKMLGKSREIIYGKEDE